MSELKASESRRPDSLRSLRLRDPRRLPGSTPFKPLQNLRHLVCRHCKEGQFGMFQLFRRAPRPLLVLHGPLSQNAPEVQLRPRRTWRWQTQVEGGADRAITFQQRLWCPRCLEGKRQHLKTVQEFLSQSTCRTTQARLEPSCGF